MWQQKSAKSPHDLLIIKVKDYYKNGIYLISECFGNQGNSKNKSEY